jgi:hypothetical protein
VESTQRWVGCVLFLQDDAVALLEAWKRMLVAMPAHADFSGYVNTSEAPAYSEATAAKL